MDFKKVVIIGAGPAGLWTARELAKHGIQPILLEKNSVVGGKCSTFSSKTNPSLKTEWGAGVVAPNYGVVLDAMREKGVEFEALLPTKRDSVEIYQEVDGLSWSDKLSFGIHFLGQLCRFTAAIYQYQQAGDNLQPLPDDFTLPFAEYAAKHELGLLVEFLRPFVTGFGYGAMDDCPTYTIMEYVGLTTIPCLLAEPILHTASLLSIKNGFQYLMERVAEDFEVVTSATVTHVDRSAEGVTVNYTLSDGKTCEVKADGLVLAIAPTHWTELGLSLTDVEKQCVAQMEYYRYPVAVCEIENYPAEMQFVQEGLEKEGFGQLALITCRDNRPADELADGRLCTAYVNLPAGPNAFQFNDGAQEKLRDDIKSLSGVKDVKILETKIWEDYMPTLPWETRLTLEKQQMHGDTRTLYVGAYTVRGFEDVACVTEQATRAVDKYIIQEHNKSFLASCTETVKGMYKNANRALMFYTAPHVKPVDTSTPAMEQNIRFSLAG